MDQALAEPLEPNPLLANLQKDAADLRRDQLTDIASRLLEAEGIDAVKHTRIARLAGCTRSLVYHYFPKRTDIFTAINTRFYTRLDSLVSVDQQQAALLANLDGAKADSMALFGILFDLIDDGGWGSLILRSTPELSSDFAKYDESIHEEYEMRWIEVIAQRLNISTVDSELFFQYSINIVKTLFMFYRKGLLTKEQAIEKLDVTLNQLLATYR